MSQLANILLHREHTQGGEAWNLAQVLEAARKNLIDGVSSDDPYTLTAKLALDRVMAILQPPYCSLMESFWDTEAGQLVAAAQYWIYRDDMITSAEAAEILFGNRAERSLMALREMTKRGELARYRKPDLLLKRPPRRGVTGRASQAWLYRRGEVERAKADRPEQ